MSEESRHQKTPLSYKSAGVNIDAGNALVDIIKPIARKTARAGADSAIGGFGAFFDIGKTGFRDPLLVASNDGVGTKVKIAVEAHKFSGIGIDLVAMCVNDLVTQGATPLFFLDYFATGKLNIEVAATVIESIADGCIEAGCALIGGETAEMPGVYHGKDLDLAGFAVGAVERDQVITGAHITAGDVILALPSSGIHSNGYSLVRKLIEVAEIDYNSPAPFDTTQTLAEALLTPTRIYVQSCLAAMTSGGVHGMVHVTGGGLVDNIPRILPKGLCAHIKGGSWDVPTVFSWLQQIGNLSVIEMLRTFNCGTGMLLIVDKEKALEVEGILARKGETVFTIGEIIPHKSGMDYVHCTGFSKNWPN